MSKDLFQRKDLVIVRIGKRGITEGVINEIKNVLEKRRVVKVKFLRSFRESAGVDRRALVAELAKKVDAELVGVRGFTAILRKRRRG